MEKDDGKLYKIVKDFQGLIIFGITVIWYGTIFLYILLDPVKRSTPWESIEVNQGIMILSGFLMATIIISYLIIYSGMWLIFKKYKYRAKLMLTSSLFFAFPGIFKFIPEFIFWASMQIGISWLIMYLLYKANTTEEDMDKASLVFSFLMFIFGYVYTYKVFIIQ